MVVGWSLVAAHIIGLIGARCFGDPGDPQAPIANYGLLALIWGCWNLGGSCQSHGYKCGCFHLGLGLY